ncbi:hypothetical protein JX580_05015 [Thiomicrospira microaerophila]|uniref:hypothetical protein n=1 Tax=Thiomicrospira microaerophila TaxID=406020 RepID=UPI00200CCC22|nr:hypothetical protein [Thiomicrospira microaerophila]UQB43238.1 hypothetical protein JX580_05015 [Thiomicrospira microaerophila]
MILNLILICLIAAVFSAVAFYSSCKWAKPLGLVHTPHLDRHLHKTSIPLTGGVVLFLVLLLIATPFAFWITELSDNFLYAVIGASILFISGIIDDIKHTSPVTRLIIQIAAASLLVVGGDIYVHSLGSIWSSNEILLGDWSKIFTIAAIVTAINAFNMIDGIDGLASGLAMIVLGAILYLNLSNQNSFFVISLIMVSSLIIFFVFNLGIFNSRRKIFLGDSGSTLLGFICAWFLIESSSQSDQTLPPIAVVFILLVPILDIFSVMFARLLNGLSPFKADQNHIHHLMLMFGLSHRKTLVVILILATFFAWIGIYHQTLGISERILFIAFMFMFILKLVIIYITIRFRKKLQVNKPKKSTA